MTPTFAAALDNPRPGAPVSPRGGLPTQARDRRTMVAELNRVLIANRGEIAIRIAKAASALGMESVSVHHAVDADSLHTRFTTTTRPIGGPTPGDPVAAYLDGEALVAAALASGCDSVHPGYGFLA